LLLHGPSGRSLHHSVLLCSRAQQQTVLQIGPDPWLCSLSQLSRRASLRPLRRRRPLCWRATQHRRCRHTGPQSLRTLTIQLSNSEQRCRLARSLPSSQAERSFTTQPWPGPFSSVPTTHDFPFPFYPPCQGPWPVFDFEIGRYNVTV
jgi:hypothetical protein